jgi:glycosyltransferase involved in cell wall biosynthesis
MIQPSIPRASLTVIIPSFRDERILGAIKSAHEFDDCDRVSVLVVDGGSSSDLLAKIEAALRPVDRLITEPDRGIFDGLNKGLASVQTDYIGWIGSDDILTGNVCAAEVLKELETCELFIGSVAFINDHFVRRITHSWPSSVGLMTFGLHNPHFGTFGRTSLLRQIQFDLNDDAADIEYFLRIWKLKPRIRISSKVVVLMAEGGFSNKSAKRLLSNNIFVFRAYRRNYNVVIATIAVGIKVGYKALSRLYFSFRKERWRETYGGRIVD